MTVQHYSQMTDSPKIQCRTKKRRLRKMKEGDEKGKEENESPEKKKQSESVSKSPSKSTDSKNLMSVKDEPSEGKEAKGVVGRKRGRPAGSKNKSADRSFTSPCGGSSPVGKKGRQSVSKLEDSEDSEDLMVQENASQVESNIEETSPVQKKDSEEDRNVSPQKLPESTNCESSEDSIGSVDRSEEKEKVDEPVKERKPQNHRQVIFQKLVPVGVMMLEHPIRLKVSHYLWKKINLWMLKL
ncbi:uncharacterized protein LOC135199393 [Macrobrachium nipponense]|uniref:uncharacterized protein LOC135199393 n=1 Tax=Macrobrachium nipponense TaxID=159736 RepID=UPI0030C8AB9E